MSGQFQCQSSLRIRARSGSSWEQTCISPWAYFAERRPMAAVMLDMDSSVSPTFGDQENTAYNGHFGDPDPQIDI
jgi:hypothetical protein